jgi:hypothetical protein
VIFGQYIERIDKLLIITNNSILQYDPIFIKFKLKFDLPSNDICGVSKMNDSGFIACITLKNDLFIVNTSTNNTQGITKLGGKKGLR